MIEAVLLEASLDERVDSGIIDLTNINHLEVIAEHFIKRGVAEEDVVDMVNELVVDEGKYPERQAFNKEGWLVTFPSKEYRDRAIKKGTHSISDPTHGKGGMNLYYKKKGKQQRQTHQDATTSEPTEPVKDRVQPTSPAAAKKPAPRPRDPAPPEEDAGESGGSDALDFLDAEFGDEWEKNNKGEEQGSKEPAGSSGLPKSDSPAGNSGEKNSVPPSAEPTQAPQPPAPPPPPPYVELSKKFAAQKAWISTPFGEWRDSQGNAVAVEALTKEIVPLKTTDREELKLFVQKHTSVA